MNLHSREWMACICESKPASTLSLKLLLNVVRISKADVFHTSECGNIVGVMWKSDTKYFRRDAFTDAELGDYFEDQHRPTLLRRASQLSYSYPIYIATIVKSRFVVVSCPYAGLLAEVVRTLVERQQTLQFVRPLIDVIYSLTSKAPPAAIEDPIPRGYWRVVLRGARLRLRASVDTSQAKLVRNIGLAGDDLRHSELFRALVESDSQNKVYFELDDTVIKVQFVSDSYDALVLKLDKYGNYTFRPGGFGSKLNIVGDFCTKLKGERGLAAIEYFPWRRDAADIF